MIISKHEFWLKELERAKAIGTTEDIKEAERQLHNEIADEEG